MIDIHNHILPGVDDGSKSIEMSIEMIKKEVADGVNHIILTPHVQSRVSKFQPKEHVPIFETLVDEVKKLKLPVDLYLGAEIFYRSHINTNFQSVSLGGSPYVLLEFSPHNETPIEEIVYDVSRMGFIPIVAHIERYAYLKTKDYEKIKATGAWIQVNATSILDLDHRLVKKGSVSYLLKNKLIDIIATDAHNMDQRKPNMKDAYLYLSKRYDINYVNQIFDLNAKKIIQSMEHI